MTTGVIIQVALAFRRPAGQQYEIRRLKGSLQRRLNLFLIIPKDTAILHVAPGLPDRVRQNPGIGVKDLSRGHRLSGWDDLIPGGVDHDLRTAEHVDGIDPHRGKHTGFP
jgi:hypothetical protein